MENMNLNTHISGQFNTELENVRNHMMAMGGLVEEQLEDALNAIATLDADICERVINKEQKVNSYEVSIDEECTQIIAKRQPAASDLRLVMTILKSVAELERIGDGAERIAKIVTQKGAKAHRTTLVSLENMGRKVQTQLHQTLDALARMDVDVALATHKGDAKLDKEFESIVRQLMTFMMEDPRSIPDILEVLWSARALERIGDRCQNICEYIIYFVHGKDVRHTSYEEMEKFSS